MESFLKSLAGAAIMTAIIFRVGFVREIVTGIKAEPAAKAGDPQRLYI